MKLYLFIVFSIILIGSGLQAQDYKPSNQRPPELTSEFRAAWVATVHNLDWPSSGSASSSSQREQALAILNKMQALKMNAVILQVRPQSDAIYTSSIEPWSPFISGSMGKSPGYDPLAFWIKEAHARGIEVHAWFNPFRALCNTSKSASSNHITKTLPSQMKSYGSLLLADPSSSQVQDHVLRVIMDVVKRYDIDGVHLDDYFYPYPKAGLSYNDGKSSAQRRSAVDTFVKDLYASIKQTKPWVRVGISPFGIWRPGVPNGIEAGVDSFEHLSADSRKWLQNKWVDYLAPQLYWRISPEKQSFTKLLQWWRSQGSRPIWPGIATARIQGAEDPSRPASEIINQIQITRQIKDSSQGHLFWSIKSIMQNRDNIANKLSSLYTQVLPPPAMTWLSNSKPTAPKIAATANDSQTNINWFDVPSSHRILIQVFSKGAWRCIKMTDASLRQTNIPKAEAIAIRTVDRFGNMSEAKVLSL